MAKLAGNGLKANRKFREDGGLWFYWFYWATTPLRFIGFRVFCVVWV